MNFEKSDGLVPAIIQDSKSGVVYTLGYMNQEALNLTQSSSYVHFWSRTKNRIWMKGEESGNKLKVMEINKDCDEDTLLIKVILEGEAACHTGKLSCFYRKLNED